MSARDLLDRIEDRITWIVKGEEPEQEHLRLRKHARNFRTLSILALIALVIQSGLLFLALFEPGLPYHVSRGRPEGLSDPHFVQMLGALTGAELRRGTDFRVLTNGDQFYTAELEAISQAQKSVCIEAYIFEKGELTQKFLRALTERARAGVQVNLVIDAIGSFSQKDDYFRELRDAGGQVRWYHWIRWNTWPRVNNRTHRELLIVDGRVGFIGGAGFADQWYKATDKDSPRWRDTMVRAEGGAVTGLQATFNENWLESSGEILTGQEYFPFTTVPNQDAPALVIGSSPTAGRSTTARVLFQTLLASATKTIHITTPYFLPDLSARSELVKAVQRGVDVRFVVPNNHNDHLLTRSSSRRLYGDLLKAGAKISEYQPSMIHAKVMIIDGLWAVVGSTNFDGRSFGINDEVNMAVMDTTFAARLEEDFNRDLSNSRQITYEEWKHRPWLERATESFGWLLERQQ